MNDIEIKTAERLRLQPGDMILVHLDREVSMQGRETIKKQIREQFGDKYPVVICAKGIRLSVAGGEVSTVEALNA